MEKIWLHGFGVGAICQGGRGYLTLRCPVRYDTGQSATQPDQLNSICGYFKRKREEGGRERTR